MQIKKVYQKVKIFDLTSFFVEKTSPLVFIQKYPSNSIIKGIIYNILNYK